MPRPDLESNLLLTGSHEPQGEVRLTSKGPGLYAVTSGLLCESTAAPAADAVGCAQGTT